jgi:hypothetical protein
VYTNTQGPKNGYCPFYHIGSDDNGIQTRQRGRIIQLPCSVKFHIFTPVFTNDIPSTQHLVIISYGQHTHPPPPAHRIPLQVRDRLVKAIQKFGTDEATARKFISSRMLPIMLKGKTSLSQEHVSLMNQDVLNYLIRKERAKEFPWGTVSDESTKQSRSVYTSS